MNSSDRDLRELAFSTSSRIFETVDSPNSFVVRMCSTPVRLMQPLMISSPASQDRGMLSPVRAAVSSVEFAEGADPKAVMKAVLKACKKVEPDCEIEL